jgi:hypothetical protein
MEYVTCDLCRGDGLVGNGPEPHMKQGEVKTCPKCKGTGKIPTGTVQEEPKVDAEQPLDEVEKKSEPAEEVPQVDEPIEPQPEPAPEVL